VLNGAIANHSAVHLIKISSRPIRSTYPRWRRFIFFSQLGAELGFQDGGAHAMENWPCWKTVHPASTEDLGSVSQISKATRIEQIDNRIHFIVSENLHGVPSTMTIGSKRIRGLCYLVDVISDQS